MIFNNQTSFYLLNTGLVKYFDLLHNSPGVLFSKYECICLFASHILEIRIHTNGIRRILEKHIFVFYIRPNGVTLVLTTLAHKHRPKQPLFFPYVPKPHGSQGEVKTFAQVWFRCTCNSSFLKFFTFGVISLLPCR